MSADRAIETRKIDNTKEVMRGIIDSRDPLTGGYTADATEALRAIEEGALDERPRPQF